jgi:hypothetical protein
LEKTPEYSGVFFGIFDTNIGFSQNQNHQKKFRIFDKLFFSFGGAKKNLYFLLGQKKHRNIPVFFLCIFAGSQAQI